jgi:hypothetical protein
MTVNHIDSSEHFVSSEPLVQVLSLCKQKKNYLLIAALLICSLFAALLFNLAGIVRHQLEARLAAIGFELQSMGVASLGMNAADISGMQLRSAEDGSLIKLSHSSG